MGLMGYQFVLNIVFVLKIQIEGTFGNPVLKSASFFFFLFSSTFPIISVLLGFYYNQSFPLSAISITEK